MTREEAIALMNVIVHMLEDKYDTDRVEEAVDMAIEALEQEPAVAEIKLQKIHFIIEDKTTASNYKVEQIKGVLDEER